MFKTLKKQLQQSFKTLANESVLFYVAINRDEIFNHYLEGFFDLQEQQSHNCNCCKSFLRQYGGIVAIINNKVVSIWDLIDNEEYSESVKNLSNYVHSLPVTDVFLSEEAKCGTDRNTDLKRNVSWDHFYIELGSKFIKHKDLIDAVKSERRTTKEVFKRSLEEISLDAVDTVLELIAQNSLYKGKEFEAVLTEFRKYKKAYSVTETSLRDNYAWITSNLANGPVARIRNTSIGTLLVALSEGTELDAAVGAFERMVAPTNYKRPTSLVTPRMIEDAKKKLEELGLSGSIDRRHANISDIHMENVIFADKSSQLKDVFQEMAEETLVNPKSLSKVEEISIEDFLNKIVPNSKSIEVLLEDRHLNNLVTLVTAEDQMAPSLFKWGNLFSWAYTGGITDSIKERVKSLGGVVDAVLRFSLQWNEDGNSICDLDLHAHEPGLQGNHIYYGNHKGQTNRTPYSGMLDIDMIRPSDVGIENITWSNKSKMKPGAYAMRVNNYDGGRNSGFTAQIEFEGQTYDFHYNKHLSDTVDIANVILDRKGNFTIQPLLDPKTNIGSKTKWNVSTNQYTRVKNIMLSPNYWSGNTPVGNKHFMFILDGCESDEITRPFFNEFLKQDFEPHRKVFEVLGAKVRVPETNHQLSGVGFSETQRNSLIVRVQGKFKRNLKINF